MNSIGCYLCPRQIVIQTERIYQKQIRLRMIKYRTKWRQNYIPISGLLFIAHIFYSIPLLLFAVGIYANGYQHYVTLPITITVRYTSHQRNQRHPLPCRTPFICKKFGQTHGVAIDAMSTEYNNRKLAAHCQAAELRYTLL